MKKPSLRWAAILFTAVAAMPAFAAGPGVHAITGVRIVTAPGITVEDGTIVIRDGVIEAAGAAVAIPPDARLWEKSELTVYPGLIEPYAVRSWPKNDQDDAADGAHSNAMVRPERNTALLGVEAGTAKKLRGAGFTTAVVSAEDGIFRGWSSILNLGEGRPSDNLLKGTHAHNVSFESNSFGDGYPSSLMGTIALIRQTLLDARWHEKAWRAYKAAPGQARPEMNSALASLAQVANGNDLVVFEGEDVLTLLRAGDIIREFGLNAHLVGTGREYQWRDEIAALGTPVLLPLNLPDLPEVPDDADDDDLSASLEDLRHWDEAPGNAKSLLEAGVTVAFTTFGLDNPKKLLSNAYLAIDRGELTADEALASLTTTPARLLGISDRAGTIEVGKMANLVIAEGDLFTEKPRLREVWIDGKRFEIKEIEPAEIEPAGTWNLTVTTGDGETIPAVLTISGKVPDLSGTVSSPTGDVELESVEVSGSTLEVSFSGASYGMQGSIELSVEVDGDSASGSGTTPDGSFTVKGTRTAQEPEALR